MDQTTSRIEKLLAGSLRSLHTAAQLAETRSDQGLADDLHMIRAHLAVCHHELAEGRRPQRITEDVRAYL